MAIKRIRFEDIKNSKGRTNKKELDAITDAQITESVLGDEDSVIPTEEELKKFEAPKKRGGQDEKKVKFKNVKTSKGKTDWNYLQKLEKPLSADVNAPILTQHELYQLKKPTLNCVIRQLTYFCSSC